MQAANTGVDKLLTYLFADKTSVYIDDIVVNTNHTYEVSWCRDFTLQTNVPRWHDTTITRSQLLSFIKAERLNYWEAFRYDDITGSIQAFTNCIHDIDIFLDENYHDVIKEFIESSIANNK